MPRIYLSLGSNVRPYHFIGSGLDALATRYDALLISPVYESPAIGFEGDAFLNLVVGFDTSQSLAEVVQALRAVEDAHGRQQDAPKFSSRTLDIDLLTYGQLHGNFDGLVLPRGELDLYAFMLCPLAELAPEDCHPVSGRRYAELWREMSGQPAAADQPLRRVAFLWRDRDLSACPAVPGAGQR